MTNQAALTTEAPLDRFRQIPHTDHNSRYIAFPGICSHSPRMDADTTNLIRAATEAVAIVTDKQALLMELLSAKLDLAEADRVTLVNSAQENFVRAEALRQELAKLSAAS